MLGSSEMFPKNIRLTGGRLWVRKDEGVKGYSSEDGNFDVLQGNGYAVLVSFIHEPNERGQEFWRKRFDTVQKAIEYAETM